jgi:hypothetical protein
MQYKYLVAFTYKQVLVIKWNMSKFSTLSKSLDLPNDGSYKNSIKALQEIVKAYMQTITKQAFIYELGVSWA